jgi:hypothetical protein
LKKTTIRVLNWIIGTGIGIISIVASKSLYINATNSIRKAIFSMDFSTLSSKDFWIGLILPFVMLAIFIFIGKQVAHIIVKLISKVIYKL